MNSPLNEATKYGPVLEKMIEILGTAGNERVKIGEAMDRAAAELDLEIPEHMQELLLRTTFRIISSGRIPGAPDA